MAYLDYHSFSRNVSKRLTFFVNTGRGTYFAPHARVARDLQEGVGLHVVKDGGAAIDVEVVIVLDAVVASFSPAAIADITRPPTFTDACGFVLSRCTGATIRNVAHVKMTR